MATDNNPTGNEPELRRVRVNGVELAYWERGEPRSERPTLLFVHATGFHGRVFDRVLEAFDGEHSICLEQRGHGRSEKVPIEHWQSQGADIVAVVDALGLERLIGIGHSMGGHALVDAAAACSMFQRLLLLDPTIAAPEAYANAEPPVPPAEHPASRRKGDFDSLEEMKARLLPKGAYRLFEPRVLDDYCRFGLVPTEDGRYRLACPPLIEASVYATSRTNGAVYDSARRITIPVTIMRAMEPGPDRSPADFSLSPTWPGLAGVFANARDLYYPDCTHFIPMQMPDEVIRVLTEEVAGWEAERAGAGRD